MFLPNETRVIEEGGILCHLKTDEENNNRYIDNIFSDYPDLKTPFSFSEVYERSKRDKPIIMQCPKKMTLDEALAAGKIKIHMLTNTQEVDIWKCISNKHTPYNSLYSSDNEIFDKIRKATKEKWEQLGEPENPMDFSFLVNWFKSVNLESKTNKYYFLRANPVKGYFMETSQYGYFDARVHDVLRNNMDIYVCEDSPSKDEISKDVLMYITNTLFLSRYDYRLTINRMYFFIVKTMANLHYGSSLSSLKNRSRKQREVDFDNHGQNFTPWQKRYSSSNRNAYALSNKHINIYQLSYAATLCSDIIYDRSICKSLYDMASSYSPLQYTEYTTQILRKAVYEGKPVIDIPFLKNVSVMNWIRYISFLCKTGRYHHQDNKTLYGIDKKQFDTAIKLAYFKISYKILSEKCGKGCEAFYEKFNGFGESLISVLEDKGYRFYNSKYAKNYVENIFQQYILAFVATPSNFQNMYECPEYYDINNNSITRVPYYVDFKSGECYVNPNRIPYSHGYSCYNDILSFGGMYTYVNDGDDGPEALTYIKLKNLIDETTDLERRKYMQIARMMKEYFVPIFDGTKLSIFDLTKLEEIKIIADLSKEVL